MGGDKICTQVDGLVFDKGRWVQKHMGCALDNEKWRGVLPLFHAIIKKQYLPPCSQKEDLGKLAIDIGRIIMIIYFTTITTAGIAVVIVIAAAVLTAVIKYCCVLAPAPTS